MVAIHTACYSRHDSMCVDMLPVKSVVVMVAIHTACYTRYDSMCVDMLPGKSAN